MKVANAPCHIAARDTRELIKLVAHRNTDELFGVTVFAPEAGDCMHTVSLEQNLT